MKKKIGDTIEIIDGNGSPKSLIIVGLLENSILQGSLAISEDHFVELFPTVGGYNTFLIDSNSKDGKSVSENLTKGLELRGFDLINSNLRLKEYSKSFSKKINF